MNTLGEMKFSLQNKYALNFKTHSHIILSSERTFFLKQGYFENIFYLPKHEIALNHSIKKIELNLWHEKVLPCLKRRGKLDLFFETK